MTSANVELVRSCFAAWERGDFSSADWAHPEVEFVIADGAAAGKWKGLAGLAQGFREILSPMEQYRVVADAYREVDGSRVLVLCRQYGRGKISGLELKEIQAKAVDAFRGPRSQAPSLHALRSSEVASEESPTSASACSRSP